MSFSDTARDAEQIQLEILRRMSEGQRLRIALEMSQATRNMVLSRIRGENPGWTDWEVKRELLRLTCAPDSLPAGLP
jgi:Rv0078B-related antitoxin